MEPLKLSESLWLIDLAVYLPYRKTLVIADLHLGYEEALQRDGVLLPPGHLGKVKERLKRILHRLESEGSPNRLVINGDLKHRFVPLSPGERHRALELIEFLDERFDQILLLKGNHDRGIEYLAEQACCLEIQNSWRRDELMIIHGDRHPPQGELGGAKLVLIGHEHPAVGLRSPFSGRLEVYKAFLHGPYRDKRLLIQPSFNLLVQGSDLARERVISPLICEEQLGEFKVYPVSDQGEIYPLGSLAALFQP